MGTTVRKVRVDGFKIKVHRGVVIFEHTSCEVDASLLPDCVMGMDIVPNWGMFPPPSAVKQEACQSAF